MNPPKPARRLRLRKADLASVLQEAPDAAAPRLTLTPWHGHGPGDWPREEELPQCPSPRCRRARACLAPVNGLYCQRTHYSREEQQRLMPFHPLIRALAEVPEADDPGDPASLAERIAALAAVRRAHDREMRARWKAGLLHRRFGKFRPGGVVVSPSQRRYVEIAPASPQKGGQGPRSAVQSPPSAPVSEPHVLWTGD